VLGAGLLAVWALGLRPRRAGAAVAAVEDVPPLERALALAREASVNGSGADGRKALERLARELGRAGLEELGGRARRLAWSPAAPTAAAVEELAGAVRAALEERA
jgi:hypothetical protein